MIYSRPAVIDDFNKLPEDSKWAYGDEGPGLLHLWSAWFDDELFIGVSIVGELQKVGVVIMPEARGRGYLEHMYPKDQLLFAEINKRNLTSLKAHEKLGFVLQSETLYGEWLLKREAI